MNTETFEFLRSIEETPSVSGYEQPVARLVRKRMEKFADSIETDVHGNLIVAINPDASPRVMLAGHMDQIGMMITYITDEGYLYFKTVGGIDNTVLPGSRVTVHNRRGAVEGVIGRKPIHLMKQEERNQGKVELENLWIDIGVKNREEALKKVAVADPVTYALGLTRIGEDLVASPGLDNKVGTFVVMEALRLAKEAGGLKCGLFAVATVQEEIGLRGARTAAYGIDPQVGIAVDVTHATDNPGAEKKMNGDVGLGKGPVIDIGPNINPVVSDLLLETAKQKEIPHQPCAAPAATGTDANAMQISRSGIATGLVSIPNRYMHTQVELVSLSDLEMCARLLAETIARIDEKSDFIPR
jgi:tetrahedral aminopeptidase